MFKYGTTNVDSIKLKLFSSSLSEEAKVWYNKLSPSVITTWEEMRQAFEDPKKKLTISTEDIEETTIVEIPESSATVNQEKTNVTHNPVMMAILLHQPPKRNSRKLILKKTCESSWSLKNHEFVRNQFFNLKTKVEQGQKNHQAAIQDLETKFVHIFNQQYQTNWFTSDGKTYDPPENLNDKPTIIHNDSDDEADKAEKEEEMSSSKPKKSDQPKNYVPSTPTQRKYGRKLSNSVECLALANLGASINLMPYSLYASLSVNTLKPTRMSIRLANHTYQYPMGVAENMLIHVGKFLFPVDFIILEMEEDNKVPLILGRHFLHTVDAITRVKSKELNLRVKDDRIAFLIDKAIQHSHSNDDTCFRIDVIDEVTEEELDALLNDSEPFLKISKQEEDVNDNFEELPLDEQLRIKTSVQEPPIDLATNQS
ncbi:reverse transcriptase domain-containing protein [Tanacetum coccineum]